MVFFLLSCVEFPTVTHKKDKGAPTKSSYLFVTPDFTSHTRSRLLL